MAPRGPGRDGVMSKPVEYNARLTERIDLTDKLAIFRIQPDPSWGQDGQVPDFEGGQYAVLGLNNTRQPEKGAVLRPYSIASPPEEKRWLEFYVRYVDRPESDNPLTHLLWDLKAGDPLHLGKKITGHFTLAKTLAPGDPRLKVFVAAGTGLAPFVSIILSYLRRGADPSQFAVLHGVRHPQDLGYRDELRIIFDQLPKRYAPTVSGSQPPTQWQGDRGRVETFFDDEKLGELEQRLGLEPGGTGAPAGRGLCVRPVWHHPQHAGPAHEARLCAQRPGHPPGSGPDGTRPHAVL